MVLASSLIVLALATGTVPEALVRQVEAQAQQAAAARVNGPDRLEVLDVQFQGLQGEAPPGATLDLVEVDGPNQSGVAQVVFRVGRDGVPAGLARARVRGRVLGPALVAGSTLPRGVAIGAGQLAVETCDLTRLGESPLRDPSAIAGRVPARSIGAGRVLVPSLLAPEPLVREGDPVELRIVRGPLTVTARGVARGEGAEGEKVSAVNVASGAVLLGRVQADGSLVVVQPRSVEGRR